MALNIITDGGFMTIINIHGLGIGGDSWATKGTFGADMAMFACTKGTPPIFGGAAPIFTHHLPQFCDVPLQLLAPFVQGIPQDVQRA